MSNILKFIVEIIEIDNSPCCGSLECVQVSMYSLVSGTTQGAWGTLGMQDGTIECMQQRREKVKWTGNFLKL